MLEHCCAAGKNGGNIAMQPKLNAKNMKIIKEIDVVCDLTASERDILAIILRSGPIARSGVTAKTQLAQQSVHRIIDSLERRGYLQFGAAKIVGRGKPSPTVSIDPSHYASVGISVGTEDVRFCLMDLTGIPLVQEVANIAPVTPAEVIAALKEKIADWFSTVAVNRTLVGVGISMQGFRDGSHDVFHPPQPLFAWENIPIETVLSRELHQPVFAENNATSSVVAEHYLGADNGHGCIAYLSFNHGFGAGIFWENRPFRGGHGNAGEISAIFSRDQLCHRPALGELIKRLADHNIDVNSVRDLTLRFEPDWPGIPEWLDEVKPQLQFALRALQATIDPHAIFFGGEAPEELRHMLVDIGKSAFTDERLPMPTLITSKLPGDPAHLGAALLPLHQLVF